MTAKAYNASNEPYAQASSKLAKFQLKAVFSSQLLVDVEIKVLIQLKINQRIFKIDDGIESF